MLIALTILISVAWFTNLAIGWVDPTRSIPAVNTIFGIVAGALYTLGQKDKAVAAIKSLHAKKTRSSKRNDDGGDRP
jgi:hypothetical protein